MCSQPSPATHARRYPFKAASKRAGQPRSGCTHCGTLPRDVVRCRAPKVVSEVFGHAGVAITRAICGHVSPDVSREGDPLTPRHVSAVTVRVLPAGESTPEPESRPRTGVPDLQCFDVSSSLHAQPHTQGVMSKDQLAGPDMRPGRCWNTAGPRRSNQLTERKQDLHVPSYRAGLEPAHRCRHNRRQGKVGSARVISHHDPAKAL